MTGAATEDGRIQLSEWELANLHLPGNLLQRG
jgi:hypothetical protein